MQNKKILVLFLLIVLGAVGISLLLTKRKQIEEVQSHKSTMNTPVVNLATPTPTKVFPTPQALRPALALTPTSKREISAHKWGEKPGEFGLLKSEESNPEGPKSLFVDAKNRILVLDQVNARIQRFRPNGTLINTVPLDNRTTHDLTVQPDGSLMALNRYGDAKISIWNEKQERQKDISLKSYKIDQPGLVTGMSIYNGKICVEVEHDALRCRDADAPDDGSFTTLPGRNTADGQFFFKSFVLPRKQNALLIQCYLKSGQLLWEKPVKFNDYESLMQVQMLESNKKNEIIVAMEVLPKNNLGSDETQVVAVKFSPQGERISEMRFPSGPSHAAERSHPLALAPDGSIHQMQFGEDGVKLLKWSFPN